ncbi:MAG: hypothetical protein P5696_24035 [Limnospira sp. PMC 1298.21]|nr:hypothetical protein [Limnospira sp. PMC 1298.21]
MVRVEPLIFSQGAEIPTRGLFRVLQLYLMPECLAPLLTIYDGSSRNIQISLVMDGWQWSFLVVGSTSRLPFPASIPGL